MREGGLAVGGGGALREGGLAVGEGGIEGRCASRCGGGVGLSREGRLADVVTSGKGGLANEERGTV